MERRRRKEREKHYATYIESQLGTLQLLVNSTRWDKHRKNTIIISNGPNNGMEKRLRADHGLRLKI